MEDRSCDNCYHIDLCYQSSKKLCNTMEHENFMAMDSDAFKVAEEITNVSQKGLYNSIRQLYMELTSDQFNKLMHLELDDAMEYAKKILAENSHPKA